MHHKWEEINDTDVILWFNETFVDYSQLAKATQLELESLESAACKPTHSRPKVRMN